MKEIPSYPLTPLTSTSPHLGFRGLVKEKGTLRRGSYGQMRDKMRETAAQVATRRVTTA